MSSTALMLAIVGILVSGGLLTCFAVFLMDGLGRNNKHEDHAHGRRI
jgi:hypothetical protein